MEINDITKICMRIHSEHPEMNIEDGSDFQKILDCMLLHVGEQQKLEKKFIKSDK